MRLTIKVSGDLSDFGIAFSQNRIGQNRIGWIELAIGVYISGTLGAFPFHHAGTDVGADDVVLIGTVPRVSKRPSNKSTACLRARYCTGVLNVVCPSKQKEFTAEAQKSPRQRRER